LTPVDLGGTTVRDVGGDRTSVMGAVVATSTLNAGLSTPLIALCCWLVW